MTSPKNIQLPYEALDKLLKICNEFQEVIHIHDIDFGYYAELDDVIRLLTKKKESLELRQSYGKLVIANKANDEEKKTATRLEYLQKRGLKNAN